MLHAATLGRCPANLDPIEIQRGFAAIRGLKDSTHLRKCVGFRHCLLLRLDMNSNLSENRLYYDAILKRDRGCCRVQQDVLMYTARLCRLTPAPGVHE